MAKTLDDLTKDFEIGENKFGIGKKVQSFLDSRNLPELLDYPETNDYWPKKLYIGFLMNVRKKDLFDYIDEWIQDNNCNRSSCYFQAIAWAGGFAFEIHEGGTGKGSLGSVLENLQSVDELTIPSSDRFVRIAKRKEGFSSYLLNEFEPQEKSAGIEFKDNMSRFYKRNHAFMISGLTLSFLSSIFFFSSWFVVNTATSNKVPVFYRSTSNLPHEQINKIADIANKENMYLKSIKLKDGKWKFAIEMAEKDVNK